MILKNDELKTTFEVPDRPTYKQALLYWQHVEQVNPAMYERLWPGVCVLATGWQSPIPLDADLLEREASAEGMAIVKWASLAVFSHMFALREIPKNS